jgi:hypothetical protein
MTKPKPPKPDCPNPPSFETHMWLHARNSSFTLSLLGKDSDNMISDARAGICRNKDGSWNWTIFNSPFNGNEPSRKHAKKAVHKAFFPE